MLEWFSLFSQLRIHMNSSIYQDNWNQKVVILSFSFSSTRFKNSLARTVAVFPHHSWHWHPSFDICPSLHLGAGFSSSCWDLMTQGIPLGIHPHPLYQQSIPTIPSQYDCLASQLITFHFFTPLLWTWPLFTKPCSLIYLKCLIISVV